MKAINWKLAWASAPGTYHDKRELPCQDFSDLRVIHTKKGETILAVLVSDGAGSAKYSKLGSSLLCYSMMEEIKEYFDEGKDIECFNRETAEQMITAFQEELYKYAEIFEAPPRQFACTMLCALIGEKSSVFFQIGDGAIVISMEAEPHNYFPVFWPMRGEYENSIFYATDGDGSRRQMEYKLLDGAVGEIAVFTDGLQRLALHFQTRTAHIPFFKPLFSYIRPAPEDSKVKLSDALFLLLSSKRVNEKTDDDKTLIIASRCGD